MFSGGARGVIVIVIGNGQGEESSNPGRFSLHFIVPDTLTIVPDIVIIECSPMTREAGVQSQVESYQRLKKWYLMVLIIIRFGSRVKWSNPGKGLAPSPTPWYRSYRKRSLWVTCDLGHQLYLIMVFNPYLGWGIKEFTPFPKVLFWKWN